MWKDIYLIGIEDLDAQHKMIFDTIENIKDTLKEVNPVLQRQFMSESVEFLREYIVTHFGEEEDYLEHRGYENLDAQKHDHEKFLAGLTELEERLDESKFAPAVARKYLGYVISWMVYHVAGEDAKFATIKGTPAMEDLPPARPIPPHLARRFDIGAVIEDFAHRSKMVLRALLGMNERDLNHRLQNPPEDKAAPCFKVELTGPAMRNLGFIYSGDFAAGLIKAMLGLDLAYLDELAYSALQEITNTWVALLPMFLSQKAYPAPSILKPNGFCVPKFPQWWRIALP